jgi:uncharacterized protein YjiS (DUF1127 family)
VDSSPDLHLLLRSLAESQQRMAESFSVFARSASRVDSASPDLLPHLVRATRDAAQVAKENGWSMKTVERERTLRALHRLDVLAELKDAGLTSRDAKLDFRAASELHVLKTALSFLRDGDTAHATLAITERIAELTLLLTETDGEKRITELALARHLDSFALDATTGMRVDITVPAPLAYQNARKLADAGKPFAPKGFGALKPSSN